MPRLSLAKLERHLYSAADRPRQECLAGFLVHVLHSYYAAGKMDQIRSETAQPAISLQQPRAFRVPRPQVPEQNLILDCISSHDEAAEREESELVKLRHVKTGLMTDLLSGRVRVPEKTIRT